MRCAKCRHSWFQDGPEALFERPQAYAPPPPPPPPPPPSWEHFAQAPAAAPVGAEPAPVSPGPAEPARPDPAPYQYEAAPAAAPAFVSGAGMAPDEGERFAASYPVPPPPVRHDYDHSAVRPPLPTAEEHAGQSSYAFEPMFRPRRNPARLWTLAAILFAIVTISGIGVVARFGLPDWVPMSRATFGDAPADLALDFPANRKARHRLPNGTEYYSISGTIRNTGMQRRAVPPLLVVMRDAHNRIVFSWEVNPPKPVLAPGESVPLQVAQADFPQSARYTEVGWKPH